MNRDLRGLVLIRSLLVFACLLLLGCDGSPVKYKVYPVLGEVFVEGKPATGAAVHLHPLDKQHPPAYAIVQDDGAFQMTTYTANDGAAAGEYVVTVNWREERKEEGETIFGPDRLGNRYSTPNKSKLNAAIFPEKNVLPRFDLKADALPPADLKTDAVPASDLKPK